MASYELFDFEITKKSFSNNHVIVIFAVQLYNSRLRQSIPVNG